ncbi:MAG: hypothetical protein RSD68_07540, partial [Oscillospiraceae bacterium]
ITKSIKPIKHDSMEHSPTNNVKISIGFLLILRHHPPGADTANPSIIAQPKHLGVGTDDIHIAKTPVQKPIFSYRVDYANASYTLYRPYTIQLPTETGGVPPSTTNLVLRWSHMGVYLQQRGALLYKIFLLSYVK